jgi:D-glycero-D-manno-heptose 1,7-bisphosphate phosphatase
MRQPCVFFDRDGIVNVPPQAGHRYIERPEEFVVLPAFLAALRVVQAHGYAAVIVTNQKGIATGQIAPDALAAIHQRLQAAVRQAGLRALADIRVSTAADDAHPDRKPNPGMLLAAARDHGLDLTRSWMIGDHESDIEAGWRAGCRTVRVGGTQPTAADFRVPDMEQLAAWLEEHLEPYHGDTPARP